MEKKNLKTLRNENRYTLDQFAKETGIPKGSYVAIERGDRKCSLKYALKIAAFYKMKVEEIDFEV